MYTEVDRGNSFWDGVQSRSVVVKSNNSLFTAEWVIVTRIDANANVNNNPEELNNCMYITRRFTRKINQRDYSTTRQRTNEI